MAPAHWTTSTWMKVVSILIGVIIWGSAYFAGQATSAGKVRLVASIVKVNTIEIQHNAEKHDESMGQVNETLRTMSDIQKTQAVIVNELNIKVNVLEERSR